MKRILSLLMFCASVVGVAQMTYGPQTYSSINPLSGYNIYNAPAGSSSAIPAGSYSGTITSIQFSATKIGGTANASDIAVYITETTAFGTGGFLFGGQNTYPLTSANRYTAHTTVSGNNVNSTFTLATPIILTPTTTIRIMNTSSTAAGGWDNVNLVINGLTQGVFDAPTYCANLVAPVNGAHFTTRTIPMQWALPLGITQTHTAFAVYLGESATELVKIGTISNPTQTTINLTLTDTDENKTFYWKIVPVNVTAEASCTTVNMFTTGEFPIEYCDVSGMNNTNERITSVSFAGITRTSANDAGGYIHYTATEGAVTAGQTYPFSASFMVDLMYPGVTLDVFIDWNQDGYFDGANEAYLSTELYMNHGTRTFNIAVPADATPGVTRMRVVVVYNEEDYVGLSYEGCPVDVGYEYGEVEDYNLVVTNTNSVGDLTNNKVAVYPNPAVNVVNVVAADAIETVTITDMNGRVVKTVALGANEGSINVSDLAKGIYILNAKSNGASTTQKIVKQ